MRPFGKTGASVSILALGACSTFLEPTAPQQALKWGVTYWDTADCYEGGNSEAGIGQFLKKYPESRETIFLVSKSDRRDPKGLTELLDRSLQRMNTDYVDLYFIHGTSKIDELNKDTRAWAEKAKSQGRIKYFGFSAHSNMEEQMTAAQSRWVDGIMASYNFRLMRTDKMRAAVDACAKAGIGLTAMKHRAEARCPSNRKPNWKWRENSSNWGSPTARPSSKLFGNTRDREHLFPDAQHDPADVEWRRGP